MYISLSHLVVSSVVLVVATIIWGHIKITERANVFAAQHCAKHGVTFLDQTVVLQRLRLKRSSSALFSIERSYGFEFSSIGDVRYQAELKMLGRHLKEIQMQTYRAS